MVVAHRGAGMKSTSRANFMKNRTPPGKRRPAHPSNARLDRLLALLVALVGLATAIVKAVAP
jgi:hypothetical protein